MIVWEHVKDMLLLEMNLHFSHIHADLRIRHEITMHDLMSEILNLEYELRMPYDLGWTHTLGQPISGEMFHTLSTRHTAGCTNEHLTHSQ